MSDELKTRISAFARLRNYFLTGLIICAPVGITIYLVWSLIGWIDSWIIPYIPIVYNPDTYLPFSIPGFGLVVAVTVITVVGFLTANYIGRTIWSYGEVLLGRMPLVRNLYSGLKQIFQTVLSDKSSSFQEVGLIEYPRKGLWAIIFIATDTRGEVDVRLKKIKQDTVSVFLPTTPNPTSGFLLFVPKKDVTILDMSVEEAAKLVISAGLVSPDTVKIADKEKQISAKKAPRTRRQPVSAKPSKVD
ncbi:MAG: DUF502 domain-containing protein [Hyphomicrobiales bacterium]|nr:DUF502 domain-containing protein [Hyphomicrobiales bacterium]